MINKTSAHYSAIIKEEALKLGFDSCGISKAEFLEDEAIRFERWLHKGMQGKMQYMERNGDKRLDPRLLVPDAKSVISLTMNYYPREKQNTDAPAVSKYAYGSDYHIIIKDRLKTLLDILNERIGNIGGRAFVDSAPVAERAWAAKSGLGWIGKNSMLIQPGGGSFYFIAELIVDIELEPDAPIRDYCGTCRRCMDSCPTQAIVEPHIVDGSKCISYFTIELKEAIPETLKDKISGWIFGCDICQDVCPWNSFSHPHTAKALDAKPELIKMTAEEWNEITEEEFAKTFYDSPLQRPGFKNLKRNISFVTSSQPS